jgi:arginase family enzyme
MPGAPDQPIQPVSGMVVPRFAGPSTFARLPELRDVPRCDVAILGIPFDAGTSYRPGARFGPQAIRQASRHLRTQYHPAYDTEPFRDQQVADAGDVACNPFNIAEAIGIPSVVERIRQCVGNHPLYLSIDVDVLDPAHAPGTGTPEIGGLTTRELLHVLRGLTGLRVVAADVVEVAPAYDHAEITTLAAATVVYELVNLCARGCQAPHATRTSVT